MPSCKSTCWLPRSSWSLLNRYFTWRSLGIYQNLKFWKMQSVCCPARSRSWRTTTRVAQTSYDAALYRRRRRLTTLGPIMTRLQQSSFQRASTSWHYRSWPSQRTHGCTCTSRQISRWSRTAVSTCPAILSSSRWWSARPTPWTLTARTCASTHTARSRTRYASRTWCWPPRKWHDVIVCDGQSLS